VVISLTVWSLKQHFYSCHAGRHSEDTGIEKATGLSWSLHLFLRKQLDDLVGRRDKDHHFHVFASIPTMASSGSVVFLNWLEN